MLRALGDPHLVAKFQAFCGLREKPRGKYAANGTLCNGQTRNGHVSKSFDTKESSPTRECKSTSGTTNCLSHRNGFVKQDVNCHSSASKEAQPANKAVSLEYNPYIHALFTFGSTLGNETFYVLFFPFLFWSLDDYLGRRLVVIWAVVMYFGQCSKDIIQWPRPPSPPAIWVEKRYQWEYGMPSTHAMVGLCIPFTLVYFTYDRYQYPLSCGVVFVVCWCLLVSTSRIYLGMHNMQDVLAGLVFALIILLMLVPHLNETTEKSVLASQNSPIFFVMVPVVLIIIYPSPPDHTLTRADTAMVLGGASGAMIGCWLRFQSQEIPDPYDGAPFVISMPDLAKLMEMLTRFVIGTAELLTVRLSMKTIVLSALPYLLPISDPKLRQTTTELSHRYLTYSVMGCIATFVVPKTFTYLEV